jgi:hypothetical protein
MSPKRRRLARQAVSQYLREAAVLVGVFGPLDSLLKPEAGQTFRWWWLVLPGGFSAVLFAWGLYYELNTGDEDLQ